MDHMYGIVTDTGSSVASSPNMSSASTIRGRSKVWNEFTVTPDGKKVTCRLCGDSLAYSNSHSTSSMLKHLKRKHNLDLYPAVNDDEPNATVSDRFSRSPPSVDKRNRPRAKKHIPKDAEEIDTSVQHGPLLFKDPCVRMKWTDHSDTFLRTFSSLYSDESYTDVTVVVEKHFFKAHRVILSSASEFFDETFKMTPAGQHPVIFLKDVKAMDLRILLDFIYKGEVSIPPALIPGLVKIGSDLRVRGLSDFVWNEQLANSIFQPQPQPNQGLSQSTATESRTRLTQPMQSAVIPPATQVNPVSTSQFQGASTQPVPNSSTNASQNKIFAPVRAVLRQTQPLITSTGTVQSQQSSSEAIISNGTAPVPRTYSRILNLRPTNPSASNSIQGQIITGDLENVCSSVAGSFPSMKRIRIVTSSQGLSQKTCKVQTQESNAQSYGTSGTGSETVLMVTNEGETVLSTTQGGVTVLTPNNAMTLPVEVALKDGRYNPTDQLSTYQNSHLHQSHPVTVVTSSHAQPNRSSELNEVVYSITEIPGDGHEVLMTQDQEMVVCGEDVDKKPYLGG